MHIQRTRSTASETQYARIMLNPQTRECPMMEEQLCAVQKELGEDKLSNTCFDFPRQTYEVAGVYHQALTLACPEAARLALLDEDAFEFAPLDLSVRPSSVSHWKPVSGLPLALMNEIRFFCIQILKTQALALWQRLVLVGLFCESLSQAVQNKQAARVPSIIESSRALMGSASLVALFDSMQANHSLQARTFGLLWLAKPQVSRRPSHQRVFESMSQGLGLDPAAGGAVSEDQLVGRYTQGVERLALALEAAPFLLEHYVLNEMFRAGFPFALNNGHPLDQFMRLVTRFGIVRFMLAIQCQPGTPLPSPADLVQTVQVFARRFQHDELFASQVDSCFQNSGWNELGKMARLLKA
jgi:lysine-N-methylase